MESDRRAFLIRQAAFEGLIDFSQARPFDRLWWQWLDRRLDLLESRNLGELHRIQHAQNLAALSVVEGDGVKEHWGRADELVIKIFNRLFPWRKQDEETNLKKEIDELSDLWAKTWGDPNDPATQQRIWATACALNPKLKTLRPQ